MLTMLCLAQYWNLLAGFAGLVSVGQQAFVGLGAYCLFGLVIADRPRPGAVDPARGARHGGGLAADRLCRLSPARSLFRHRHLGRGGSVPAAARAIQGARRRHRHVAAAHRHQRFLPRRADRGMAGPSHRRGARRRHLLAGAGARRLHHPARSIACCASRAGLALSAIRDSEVAASSVGVDAMRTKLWVYVLCAFGTGMTGALIYLQIARISPDAAFSVLDWTAMVIFIVVIGGIGSIEGPIVGVIVFFLMRDQLATFGPWYLMLLGALAIAVMLFFRKGLWGTFAERYDIHLFPGPPAFRGGRGSRTIPEEKHDRDGRSGGRIGPAGSTRGGAAVDLRRRQCAGDEIPLAVGHAARPHHQPARDGGAARPRPGAGRHALWHAAGADGRQRVLHLPRRRGTGPPAHLGQPPDAPQARHRLASPTT